MSCITSAQLMKKGWISDLRFLDFFTFLWMNVMTVTSFQGCFFHYHSSAFFFSPFFPFCGSKPYFLLTNDLLSAARRALMLFVLTTLFHSSEQSWLSKVLKYVPNFTYTKSESKVSGSHFGMCWSTLLYWVSYILKTCWYDSTSPTKPLLIVWINLYHR